ncbi:hypothetical protein LJC45_02760 [Alistipes sp. OttesenSCG-928-B03]|nr:hypothetical protein [Alistipes sp. OttesenSCG-928-B03]
MEYKRDNSLDRFIQVEFAKLNKEYYYYSSEVKDVEIGFMLTPLLGEIEQIKFNYRYSAKIDDFFGEKHRCICTKPISSPRVMYWELEYSDEKRLKSTSTTEFLRDYDIAIEITDVRKDGINYSIDDWNIPTSVLKTLNTDSSRFPYLYESYKEDIIRELLCRDYTDEYSYASSQYDLLIKAKFPNESVFLDYLNTK